VFLLVLAPVKWIEPRSKPWLPVVIVKAFQPLTRKNKMKTFSDFPWRSLPMDNQINDTILSTEFTEIWVPMSHAHRAMVFLRDMYITNGYQSTGYYATELYAARKCDFWMSPAYKTDVLRIDLFWFTNNEGDPSAKTAKEDGFFNQFWDGLKTAGIPFRLHWGKFLPGHVADGVSYRGWAAYLKSQYPKWDQFMQLRQTRDPHNIFLTNYWSLHLFGKPK
jgi:hypothetical protein